jgi:ATP-dependent exoDNAse (exonuclease V) alpha subunit
MRLTEGQNEVLKAVKDLMEACPKGGQVVVVSGYAGTGKTTCLRALDEQYDGEVLVLTPTGKAALRAREAAGVKAKTLASYLYTVVENEHTGALDWSLKPMADMASPACGFLVVDEASMVSHKVFADLFAVARFLGINLVMIGDNFQLPPVESDKKLKSFSVFDETMPVFRRVKLTEVLRQALDSPIIRASMAVREGKWVNEALDELDMIRQEELLPIAAKYVTEDGAIVCHTNATRGRLNREVREFLKYPTEQLLVGEKLMVTQNNYQIEKFNGEIFTVDKRPKALNVAPIAVKDGLTNNAVFCNYMQIDVLNVNTGDSEPAVICDKEVFGLLGDVGTYFVKKTAKKNFSKKKFGSFLHANLGYVLSCHKAQGSEFSAGVLCLEDTIRFNTTEGRRWVYTGLTRFKKEIKLCWV